MKEQKNIEHFLEPREQKYRNSEDIIDDGASIVHSTERPIDSVY